MHKVILAGPSITNKEVSYVLDAVKTVGMKVQIITLKVLKNLLRNI